MNELAPSHVFDEPPESGARSLSPQLRRLIEMGCWIAAFLVPIRLSLTYIALIPLICAATLTFRHERISAFFPARAATIVAPLLFFLFCVSISALTGVAPARSVASLLSLLFFSLTIPVFFRYASPYPVLLALISGQTISALHSTLDAIFPGTIPHLFVGKVTESGQLAVTIPILAGTMFALSAELAKENLSSTKECVGIPKPMLIAGVLTLLTLIGLSFRDALLMPRWAACSLATIIPLLLGICAIISRRRTERFKILAALTVVCGPLLLNALLVNLKRGPWFGVIAATLVFCSFFAKRLIAVVVAAAVAAAILITPVRERIADSWNHFTISGGRSTIWRIGAELASEYPLGIGHHNSGILRQFAPEIPPELKHFHNNILNITAESGWLAGLIFIWFIFSACGFCLRQKTSPILVAFGCAVLSWQVAGLVEYNFGDSEITLLIWIALGLALQMTASGSTENSSNLASLATGPLA
jgi:hypothetical protein